MIEGMLIQSGDKGPVYTESYLVASTETDRTRLVVLDITTKNTVSLLYTFNGIKASNETRSAYYDQENEILYLGTAGTICSFDCSDLSNITLLNEIDTYTTTVSLAMSTDRSTLYAATTDDGVTYYDVTNPSNIDAKGFITRGTGSANQVAVNEDDDLLYFAETNATAGNYVTTYSYSIANPQSPTDTGNFYTTSVDTYCYGLVYFPEIKRVQISVVRGSAGSNSLVDITLSTLIDTYSTNALDRTNQITYDYEDSRYLSSVTDYGLIFAGATETSTGYLSGLYYNSYDISEFCYWGAYDPLNKMAYSASKDDAQIALVDVNSNTMNLISNFSNAALGAVNTITLVRKE